MTLNRARSNLAQAKSPHPLSPDAGTGLLVSSRLGFVTERIPECKSAPYWKGARTGFGAYSEVFRIQEHVHHDTDVFTRTPLSRTLVAKVFRDSAPNDYEAVYASELRTLLALGHHERIVELRGAADNMPPTFVCGHIDCGQVFQIECCPQCSQPLRNGIQTKRYSYAEEVTDIRNIIQITFVRSPTRARASIRMSARRSIFYSALIYSWKS